MRRKNFKLRQYHLNSTRVNSVQLSKNNNSHFIIGDSHNNVRFYKLNSDHQDMCLNSNQNINVQTQVSVVSFNLDESQIFSGSNRGIINLWDINTAKSTCTLKGHSTAVNCFAIFMDSPDRLASGSYDTNIKLWDIRSKNNTNTLKHHSKPVNSIDISPDSYMLISGSEDATVKLWDLRYQKLMYTYTQHTSSILKVKFNPQDRRFASCSMDRTAKYFQCQPNNSIYLSSTDLIATPITAITFSQDGRLLYTAANDSLKIWNMAKNGLLVDQVQSNWKGVLDIGFVENGLAGIAFNSGCISAWITQFNKKNTKNQDKPDKQQEERLILPKIRNNVINFQDMKQALNNINHVLEVVNNIDIKKQSEDKKQQQSIDQQQLKYKLKEQHKIKMIKQQQQERNRIKQQQQIKRILSQEKRKKEEENKKRYQLIEKQRIQRQKQLQNKIKNTVEDNLINQDMELTLEGDLLDRSQMNLSTFIGNGVQKQKLVQIEIIGDILKGNSKYQSVINQRTKAIKAFLHYWQHGKIKQALITLSQNENSIIMLDCISSVMKAKQRNTMSPQSGIIFVRKLSELMISKHSTFVKKSMNLINDIVLMFKDEIIKVKNFNPMTRGVDLSREQRVAKYDLLIQQFLNVFKQQRLKKYANTKKPPQNQEIHSIAVELYKNLQQLLRKIMPKKQPQSL